MKKFCCLFIGLIVLFNFSYARISLPDTIRIGLSYGINAVSSFTLYSESGIVISDVGKMTGTVTFSKKGSDELSITNGKKTKTCTVDKEYGISVSPAEEEELIKYNDKEYRGNFVIFRFSDSDITVINFLDLEEYLYGVVPKELSTGFPIEVLKAQAVAARTYAYKSIDKYKKWNFDMTNTTSDQAYGGASIEKEDTNCAVDETKGEVITYKGEPINAYYFSTSAGYTENSENVWTYAYPYLVAVEDKYQSDNLTYSNWSVTFTAKEIKEILEDKSVNIGNILGVNILSKSPSNGVLELEFKGSKDSYLVTKAYTRSVFNSSDVRSQFFDITSDNSVTVLNLAGEKDTIPISSVKVATLSKSSSISSNLDKAYVRGDKSELGYSMTPTEYLISGKGWGHGVGMSQNGAIAMARNGFEYDEILKWYYTGVEIED